MIMDCVVLITTNFFVGIQAVRSNVYSIENQLG